MSQQMNKTLEIVQQQIGSLISSESTRKPERQYVRIENLVSAFNNVRRHTALAQLQSKPLADLMYQIGTLLSTKGPQRFVIQRINCSSKLLFRTEPAVLAAGMRPNLIRPRGIP